MRFKVHGVEADSPEEFETKDNWTRPAMSAMSLPAWKSGSDVKHRIATKHLGAFLLILCISFIL